jgi:hypothetical protein
LTRNRVESVTFSAFTLLAVRLSAITLPNVEVRVERYPTEPNPATVENRFAGDIDAGAT